MSTTLLKQRDQDIDPVHDEKTIEALAELSSLEYARVRSSTATELGFTAGTLDRLVKEAKRQKKEKKQTPFPQIESWPNPVNPAELLTEIENAIRRFIACESHVATAATLWIAMTWLINEIQVAPLAMITGPEKRCGKSQLLLLLNELVYRPMVASNITPAALFRCIDEWQPTLLIDEADTFMQQNEELRGLINAGHTRKSAYVVRLVGDDHAPKSFCVWGAKAIAGIGKLHDTIMDRSIILEMRRKLPDEKVERLRYAQTDLFEQLTAKLARFSNDYAKQIKVMKPSLPEQLHDRAQDNWEPLLAIADIAGGKWPVRARNAALFLNCTVEPSKSISIELLEDTHELFTNKDTARITTQELILGLCLEPDKPWSTYNHGVQISPRQIASLLKKFSIKPLAIRTGLRVEKGYIKSDFEDAWARYLNFAAALPEPK